jgi:OOP family OmpA-OmpF porin
VQEQEENWQTDDIEACRDEFDIALARLEDELAPPSGVATTAASPEVYLVFFAFDRAGLNPVAERVVRQIVIDRLGANPERIEITGNADRSGSASYNERLSARRAETVQRALVEAGIDPAAVVTRADGERMPRVPTADGVREPQNRNAEIRFVN